MLKILPALLVVLSLGLWNPPAFTQSATTTNNSAHGDWTGTLETPGGKMRLWLTVQEADDGSLSAVLESIDQAPGQKIPTKNVTYSDNKLRFDIPAIGANYEGTWDANNKAWVGTFSQGIKLQLTFKQGAPKARAVITGVDGNWRTVLDRNGKKLRLVIKVKSSEQGTIVTFDALDAPAYDIPVANFTRTGNNISFAIPAASARFEGMLNENSTSFSGTWNRTGQPATQLTFSRDKDTAAAPQFKRPQNPTGTLPYLEEEVQIKNANQPDVVLAGTLTLPKGKGPFPAAILISGSGASDRNESFMGHKPFLVLADHLTRNGIAVLRYDDRGTAQSTGNYSTANSEDFSHDANAAFRYLTQRPEINTQAIGFIGHSEGGLIAPISLQTNKSAAFMVMLAGPGTNTRQLVISQARLTASAAGASEAEMGPMLEASKRVMTAVAETPNLKQLKNKLDTVLDDATLTALRIGPAHKAAAKAQFTSPWYRYFISYDPANYLPRISVPILAIGGSLDIQVPSAENLAGIKKLTTQNKDVTIHEFQGLNHLFQTAKTGTLGEYRDIEETFAPQALEMVSSWINKRF